MKNIIIVEGITDKKFIESYINYLQDIFSKQYFLIDSIVKDAKGQDAIYSILNAQKISIAKGETKNIGILLDADTEGISAKIENKINPAIEKAFSLPNHIKSQNTKYPIEFQSNIFNIFCYIFNINGKGELEDILKEIRIDKNTKTPMCLDKFLKCLDGFNLAYTEKEYKKNFIYFYGYDCIKNEGLDIEKTKEKLKNYDYYSSDYLNFNHDILKELKLFLSLFN
ncbi:MAG: hypothetical protein HQK72_08140 [Desulfamplus sp.]|nr:hypothetical protein [Desulfamplus sp.]